MPVVLATQEAEIRRIVVQSHPREIVQKTLSWKILHKNTVGGMTQGEGPEFKPKYPLPIKRKDLKGHWSDF
jgi:hypothetical protein